MTPSAASKTKGAALLLSIVPGTQEAETGGLLEPMSSRADLATQQDSTWGTIPVFFKKKKIQQMILINTMGSLDRLWHVTNIRSSGLCL